MRKDKYESHSRGIHVAKRSLPGLKFRLSCYGLPNIIKFAISSYINKGTQGWLECGTCNHWRYDFRRYDVMYENIDVLRDCQCSMPKSHSTHNLSEISLLVVLV